MVIHIYCAIIPRPLYSQHAQVAVRPARGEVKVPSQTVRSSSQLPLLYYVLFTRYFFRPPIWLQQYYAVGSSNIMLLGFLWSGEITIPNNSNYDPSSHLNSSDTSVDNFAMPSIIQVRIKASKTDPFRQGVNIHLGRTGSWTHRLTPLHLVSYILLMRM